MVHHPSLSLIFCLAGLMLVVLPRVYSYPIGQTPSFLLPTTSLRVPVAVISHEDVVPVDQRDLQSINPRVYRAAINWRQIYNSAKKVTSEVAHWWETVQVGRGISKWGSDLWDSWFDK